MTYKQIREEYKIRNNKSISTCAIADARRKLGYPVKVSKNRIDKNKVQKGATVVELGEIKIIMEKYKASP